MTVMLCYPVLGINYVIPSVSKIPDEAVTMGFGIQFPENVISMPIQFGVVDPNNPNLVTIDSR